jgi:bifunctional pyridoxal-dependent enzyme with beta-cystathionase and maltose regulon repressor activities
MNTNNYMNKVKSECKKHFIVIEDDIHHDYVRNITIHMQFNKILAEKIRWS